MTQRKANTARTTTTAIAAPAGAREDDLRATFDSTFGTKARAPKSFDAVYASSFQQRIAQLADPARGRIGVAAIDLATGEEVAVLGDQLFPMASTSKVAIVATFLDGVDKGRWKLTDRFPMMMPVGSARFSGAKAPVRPGQMLAASTLIELAITRSDNHATDALLAVVGGLIGIFVNNRDMSFAVHGISELSFAGAAIALLFGIDVVFGSLLGSLVAAGIIGWLGARARERNSIVAVLMPAGLGLGILALSLYEGRAANKFGLLTGQIVAVNDPQLVWLAGIALVVIVTLLLIWRPLNFASLDPEVAAARGVPTRMLAFLFMLLLGLSVAASVQVVGALLVLSLLVTPAASALKLSSSPVLVPLLSVAFALIAVIGGILLAVGAGLPISPYVTTISFAIYGIARAVAAFRTRRGGVA